MFKISSALPSISQLFTGLSGLCIVPPPLYFYTVAPRKSQLPTLPDQSPLGTGGRRQLSRAYRASNGSSSSRVVRNPYSNG